MTQSPADWPVLKRYDENHLARIAMPVGGIGTGCVSLGGRGDLRDWEIVNRPAKGFNPGHAFFALYARPDGGKSVTRLLQGPMDVDGYDGMVGSRVPQHGLPRFRQCEFHAAYPLGQVLLSDPDVPLSVRAAAFNPLIPADSESSGIPVAVLRFVLTNESKSPVHASVCGVLENFIGADGSAGAPKRNMNEFRGSAASGTGNVVGVFMRSDGVDPNAEQFGTMALVALAPRESVTHRTNWLSLSWNGGLLDFWDDFSADGRLDERPVDPNVESPIASLAASVDVPGGESRSVTFLITWHFPNRQTWTPGETPDDRIGNYYTTRYADAWDVAVRTSADLERLEGETVAFVRAFCESDLPDVVKEAALFNLSTLKTQTCFRTADGLFFGWEGCHDKTGCCHGSCTHVWNYEQATAFLFGDLARSMRDVEFRHTTGSDNGLMSFRANLPLLSRGRDFRLAAADGQMGCLMKLYRDWQLCGDDAWLRSLWPMARKALEFCWITGGWDADGDGVMEGCQHNTMDVEYYGPNPQMTGWYLGALRACEEMARHVGDDAFARTCRDLFERGSRWMDERLFNGDYYEHEVRPPADVSEIATGLRVGMGSEDLSEPDLQLGAGCLVDQLVGQYVAHVCGLGYLHDASKVRTTLASVMRYNFRENLFGHFNTLRSFALQEESALLMASYPKGRRPKRPFPYYTEVMTGFEYTAAVGMIYEGQIDAALKVIESVRARYDGRKRSPFDEAECGHHYARAMASWGAMLALTGFHYSAVDGAMTFAASEKPVRWFWSTGSAWGVCRQKPSGAAVELYLDVLGGTVPLRTLTLSGFGQVEVAQDSGRKDVRAGDSVVLLVRKARA